MLGPEWVLAIAANEYSEGITVRWILGPEWVPAITVNAEYYGDGKMDTRPGVGSSYYHHNKH